LISLIDLNSEQCNEEKINQIVFKFKFHLQAWSPFTPTKSNSLQAWSDLQSFIKSICNKSTCANK